MKRFGLSGWVGLLSIVLMAVEVWAGRPALMKGPERAFLRRGPGTEFQAYATVEHGESVQVEEVTGSWALVRTANGQSGYIHASFLFYPDNQPVLVAVPTGVPATATPSTVGAAAPPPVAAAPAAVVPTPARTSAASETGDLAQRNVELTTEVEALRREVETLRRNPSAAPSQGDDVVALRAEVRRLADITDALRSRLDAPSTGSFPLPVAGDEPWSTSTVVVLAGSGLLLGWVIGGVLARREERGRRNRIRF